MSTYAEKAAGKARDAMNGFSVDDVLESIGLARKSQQTNWMWSALSGLGIGLLVGVGVGLAFAPKKGTELRSDLGEKLRRKQIAAAEATRRAAETMERPMI